MALIYLYPVDFTVSQGTWFITGAATRAEAIDDPAGSPDDDTTYINGNRTGGLDAEGYATCAPLSQQVSSIEYATGFCRVRSGANDNTQAKWKADIGMSTAQTIYTSGVPIAVWTDKTNQQTDNWDETRPWGQNDFASPWIYFVGFDTASGGVNFYVTSCYIEISAELAPAQIEQAREVIARSYWYRRVSRGRYSLRVPLDVAVALKLGDHAWVSDHAGHHSTDGGWLLKAWQKRLFYLQELTISQEGGYGQLVLADKRSYLTRYFDAARGRIHPRGYRDGVLVLSPATVTRVYIRDSEAWSQLQGSVQATVWAEDFEVMANDGEVLEGSSSNVIPYSAFSAGSGSTFTGWTQSGTGANGSAIDEETDEATVFFGTEVGFTRCPKFTAGDPISGDLKMTSTASASQSADTVGCFQIWTRDGDITDPLSWSLQRGYDSNWWDDDAGSWGGSQVWNACDGSLTWNRTRSKIIDVGSNATTLTAVVGIPAATGTAAQVNHVGLIQWEPKPLASTPIVTEATAVTRSASRLLISNDSGARTWPARYGAFAARVKPQWNSADLASGDDPTLVYVYHDADNWARLWYDVDNARWTFSIRADGTTYNATKTATVTADTETVIAARWTGAAGELDLTPYTASVFVDRVKGTDAVVGEAMTEVASSNVEIGSHGAAGTNALYAQSRPWRIVQYVPTDAEIGGLV